MRSLARSLSIALVLVAQAASTLTVAASPAAVPVGEVSVDTTTGVGPKAQTVYPETIKLADGGIQTTYTLPDGEVITSTTPPPGFDPLTATDAALTEFGFPLASSDPADLEEWTAAMAAFSSDEPPIEPIQFVPASEAVIYSTVYGTSWGGYVAGEEQEQSHHYVAVKANFHVPSNTGTCGAGNIVAFWIGMGGTYRSNSLVQQGIECGDSHIGSGSAYRPFTEFANTAGAVPFCGYGSWTLSAGHVIYQNMSFQTSTNKAFFYMEDQTSGVTHSCSLTPPSGWSWDLNTAEWIGEAPLLTAINFGSVAFTNARTELYSNSSWVTLGSQGNDRFVDGQSGSYYCIYPGNIGADGATFTDTWHQSSCFIQ